MNGCGLVGCTPTPTLGPTGLTHAEALALGNATGELLGIALLGLLLVLALILSAVVWAATR